MSAASVSSGTLAEGSSMIYLICFLILGGITYAGINNIRANLANKIASEYTQHYKEGLVEGAGLLAVAAGTVLSLMGVIGWIF